MTLAQRTLVRRVSLVAYLLLITLLSLMPADGLPDMKLFPQADKWIHMTMYAGFTFLLFYNWPDYFCRWRVWLPFFAVIAWGLAMELLQATGQRGRAFDLYDELANLSGFFPGWLLWRWFARQLPRETEESSPPGDAATNR